MQSENVYRYRLLDAQGREVKTGKLTSSTTLLDLEVEPGVYFFELYENNSRWEVINYTRF